MAVFGPDDPWFYLVFFGSFLVFMLLFGIVITLVDRRKKSKAATAEATPAEAEPTETAESANES